MSVRAVLQNEGRAHCNGLNRGVKRTRGGIPLISAVQGALVGRGGDRFWFWGEGEALGVERVQLRQRILSESAQSRLFGERNNRASVVAFRQKILQDVAIGLDQPSHFRRDPQL